MSATPKARDRTKLPQGALIPDRLKVFLRRCSQPNQWLLDVSSPLISARPHLPGTAGRGIEKVPQTLLIDFFESPRLSLDPSSHSPAPNNGGQT